MRFVQTFRIAGATLAGGFVLSLAAACTVSTTQGGFDTDAGRGGDAAKSDGGGGASDGGGGGGGSAQCNAFCNKAAAASCPSQGTCVADCDTQTNAVAANCKGAWTALLECAATKGSFAGCDSSGKPKLTGCDSEALAFLQCKPSGGGGDGGTNCGNLTSGNATCDGCVNQSCCAEALACSTNTTCVDFLNCAGNCNGSATCISQCESRYPNGVQAARTFSSCIGSRCDVPCR